MTDPARAQLRARLLEAIADEERLYVLEQNEYLPLLKEAVSLLGEPETPDLEEAPTCEKHGTMVSRDEMGREWYCAVCDRLAESPVSGGTDSPLMKAWDAYKATEEYRNTRTWAGVPAHTEGSLWSAFVEGYKAAGVWEAARTMAMLPSSRKSK